ncbi:hypothetical protein LSH36_780g01022 [Paralvinella palmiformis]|uniref:Uncharacterized protein n=1 Tax=Paralvinella palmiformis TaxID=53620 RepID=A0AAD9J200_9ANNE|nr:hypothetical protein LSH36_780g01022 [Paralvinella palmiformis]
MDAILVDISQFGKYLKGYQSDCPPELRSGDV